RRRRTQNTLSLTFVDPKKHLRKMLSAREEVLHNKQEDSPKKKEDHISTSFSRRPQEDHQSKTRVKRLLPKRPSQNTKPFKETLSRPSLGVSCDPLDNS